MDTEHLVRGAESIDTTFDITQLNWRDFYQDPYLTSLIDSALANNIDMKIAIARVEQASSYLRRTWFPQSHR